MAQYWQRWQPDITAEHHDLAMTTVMVSLAARPRLADPRACISARV
jgi:hypothetical protein